jgi:phosphatidylserine decarboxylase
VRSRKAVPEDVDVTELEDDGMSTSDESGDESDIEGDISFIPTPEPVSEPPLLSEPVIVSPRPTKPPQSPSFLPRVFTPRLPRFTPQNVSTSTSTDPAVLTPLIDNLSAKPPTPSQSPSATSRSAIPGRRVRRPRFRRNKKGTDYSFSTGNDILGIVMLEIGGAEDLPKLKNSALHRKSPLSTSH